MRIYNKLPKAVVIGVPILAIVAISIGSFYVYKNKEQPRKSLSDDYVITEPEAPAAQGKQIDSFIYQPADGNQTTLFTSAPGSLVSLSIEKGNASNNLKIIDKSGKEVAAITEGSIVGAGYITNDTVYYQVSGASSAGIYKYDINKKQKELVISTNDSMTFRNITFIDKDSYFFIQANTGKIGFGKVGNNEVRVIDEKVLPVKTNYAQVSAYKFAGISPDKKFIAVLDLSAGNEKTRVKIFPVTATSMKDLHMEAEIPFLAKPLKVNEDIYSWSSDSKLLQIGDNATVLDLIAKKSIFSLDKAVFFSRLSPQKDKLAYCFTVSHECQIQNLVNNSSTPITKDIGQMMWISNNDLVLTIGERLYTFNTIENKLYSLSSDKGRFELISSNPVDETALVRINGNVIQIKNSTKDKQI